MDDDELRRMVDELVRELDPTVVDQFTFRGAQYDRGLAWVHFPVGKGGLGISRGRQSLVSSLLRDAGAPYIDLVVNPIGIGMAAPTVLAYGTEEMQEAYLRKAFTGEEIWCQLFSEPSSGSDLAGIQSRAVRDGDDWSVDGQKVWTTLAHKARRALLLARTDPDAPKHRGLTYFVLDMEADGVEVRPLFQITGEAEFNEVFLTDVRVPATQMLGGEGDGWRVATTTLMNERSALGGSARGRGTGPIKYLVECWDTISPELDGDRRAVLRDRVTDLWIRAEVLRLTGQRAKDIARSGQPGPEGSVTKLLAAELNKAISEAGVDLLGAEGMLHPDGYPMVQTESTNYVSLTGQFLRSRANTIEGGTSEIMRNIIGERVLGLPAEPGLPRDLPWKDIPR